MGQGEIIEALKRGKGCLTTKEIAKKCQVGVSCTHVKLRKLRELGEVKMIKKKNKYFYELKK